MNAKLGRRILRIVQAVLSGITIITGCLAVSGLNADASQVQHVQQQVAQLQQQLPSAVTVICAIVSLIAGLGVEIYRLVTDTLRRKPVAITPAIVLLVVLGLTSQV